MYYKMNSAFSQCIGRMLVFQGLTFISGILFTMNYAKLASEETLVSTVRALKNKRYSVEIVKSSKQALELIKKLIPKGATVMNGSSVTLDQIGYFDYLKVGVHGWVDLHAKVTAENDPAKRGKLRREAAISDYYLGSVHALTEDGEFVIASNTGSQLPHVVFTSPNLVFVVSTKKIVKDVPSAFKRLEQYVYPLEDKSSMRKYNSHTAMNKVLIFKGEAAFSTRKIHFILVKEDLGY